MEFYTIGHSIRQIEEFISILDRQGIGILADVRAFPSSSKYPQFNGDNLKTSLSQAAIEYRWLGKELGGYRKESDGLGEQSPNTGWKAGGFRIYADYMLSDRFKSGIQRLIELAEGKKTVFMCAERLYWKCHRRLISDYLSSQGHKIWHILDAHDLCQHRLAPFARLKDGILTYPARQGFFDPFLFWEKEKPDSY